MSTVPTVSIGLPVYNGERFLARALNSLSCQTFGDLEILISDNGSIDATEEICRDFCAHDKRATYRRHDRNRGAAWNYNFTVGQARGTFFKWAAHDDELAPQFIEKCLHAFRGSAGSAVLCYPRTLFIDTEGSVYARFLDNLALGSPKPRQRLYRLLRVIARCNPVFGLIRLEALRRTRLIGSYIGADKVLLAELSLMGTFREVPDYLFLRRMHEGISTAAAASDRELLDWFEPGKGRARISFSRVKLAAEYVRAVAGADLSATERRACYKALWRLATTSPRHPTEAFTQKVSLIDGTDISRRVLHVKRLIENGDFDAAYRACRKILSLRPWTTPALHLMSVIQLKRGELGEARDAALAALWRDDREAPFHNTLGIVEKARGDDRAATAAFERALACNPAYREAYLNLGLVWERAGNPGLAREYRDKADACIPKQ